MTSRPGANDGAERRCSWCRELLMTTSGRFCGRRCRQSAWRLHQRAGVVTATDRPMHFAYADPPYPGLSAKYYRREATYAGEVDHRQLVSLLQERHPDGWALSTSAKALRDVLPLCPVGARVCAWSKPHGASPLTYGIHNVWEPVIVVGGRARRPGIRDHLSALPARGGGTLPGRKPVAFVAWLFQLLGMQAGDTIADLFPGTGIVTRAWDELSSGAGVSSGDDDDVGEDLSDVVHAGVDDIVRARGGT